ncbi:Transcriptional regulator, AraC family protein [Minicystis rosea]|nr:Transcriptional regulator, AraC family protein [Minicystis rosea]
MSDAEAPPADALSEVLQDLRLADGTYGRCELTRPWGIDFPPQEQARFHFVVSGAPWLLAPKRGWLELSAGDVVLLPRGARHALSDRARGRLKPLDEMPLEEIGERTYAMRSGGGGAPTVLVCCSVSFEQPAMHPLLEMMPPMILLRGGGTRDAVLPVLLDAMADEVLARRVGAATVMTRLADVVITRVVRAWVESRDDTEGWLAAIRDPQIGRALAAIHRGPGEPWSVESLADVARVSRSTFSERFTCLVGAPPARYLARFRMHVASGWLRNDNVTVAEAATRLGYQSEAAFSRAFKRFVGAPPGAVRRQGR